MRVERHELVKRGHREGKRKQDQENRAHRLILLRPNRLAIRILLERVSDKVFREEYPNPERNQISDDEKIDGHQCFVGAGRAACSGGAGARRDCLRA